MIIYVQKLFTDGQPKTIVRNITIKRIDGDN